MNSSKFQEILARMREQAAAKSTVSKSSEASAASSVQYTNNSIPAIAPGTATAISVTLPNGKQIELTPEQQAFVEAVKSGKDVVLIGPAGTGKTTAQYAASLALMQQGSPLHTSTKWLSEGAPGIAVMSYTNRATNNIRKNLPAELQGNCITYHKLMEYMPVYEEIMDEASGEMRTRRMFYPQRNRHNPLPHSLRTNIIEESSMMSVEFFKLLMEACPHKPQTILLGDIYQLPPVYDPAILGFRLCDPNTVVIELTKVHRQALESSILRLATAIRQGEEFSTDKLIAEYSGKDDIKLIPLRKRIAAEYAIAPIAKVLCGMIDNGTFNTERDIILIPHEKEMGATSGERLLSTTNINKHIATHLCRKRMEPVHHIIAGFRQHYFAVGDKVFYNKEEGYVKRISRNGKYLGKAPQHASMYMDHYGTVHDPADIGMESDETIASKQSELEQAEAANDLDSADSILAALDKLQAMEAASEDSERSHAASHVMDIELADGTQVTLDKAAEFNTLLHGYALTVHKAQGCEWEHVVCIFHNSHQKMTQRELLYTAITRAKGKLTMFFEADQTGKPGTFITGVRSQRIKGNTLAEKAEFFKGKYVNDANELNELNGEGN